MKVAFVSKMAIPFLGERKPVQARLPCEIWEKSRFESARCTDVFEEGSGIVGKLLLAE